MGEMGFSSTSGQRDEHRAIRMANAPLLSAIGHSADLLQERFHLLGAEDFGIHLGCTPIFKLWVAQKLFGLGMKRIDEHPLGPVVGRIAHLMLGVAAG